MLLSNRQLPATMKRKCLDLKEKNAILIMLMSILKGAVEN